MDDELIQDIVNRIKILTPQIELADDTLKTFAGDSYDQALADGFEGKQAVVAASYLASHMAFVASNKNSKVKKEQADVLSREYFESNGTDDYLDEYTRMKKAIIERTQNVGIWW